MGSEAKAFAVNHILIFTETKTDVAGGSINVNELKIKVSKEKKEGC